MARQKNTSAEVKTNRGNGNPNRLSKQKRKAVRAYFRDNPAETLSPRAVAELLTPEQITLYAHDYS